MDKFCRNCGTPLKDQPSFCPKCGTPVSTASAGMEPGPLNGSGPVPAPGPAPAPVPASGRSSSGEGDLLGAIITGVVMGAFVFLPYAKLGSMSFSLMDSNDVWVYFACVAVLVVSELIDKPILSVVGGAASILYNLYEIGDAQDTLGIFSDALDLSWGFWLIMIFSGLAVLSGIINLWKTKNGR
jgi:hypothetical protein